MTFSISTSLEQIFFPTTLGLNQFTKSASLSLEENIQTPKRIFSKKVSGF